MTCNTIIPAKWLALALISTMAFTGAVLCAGPVGYRSIPDLVAASDIIVVGEIAALEVAEAGDAGVLVLLVSEVIDGNVQDGPLRISYKQIRGDLGYSRIGKRALVFAKKGSGAADFELVPMLDGNGTFLQTQILVADSRVTGPLVEHSPKDSATQRVIKEMATIYSSSDSSAANDAMIRLTMLAWSGQEKQTLRQVFRAIRQGGKTDGLVSGTSGLVALGGLDGLESLDAAHAQGAQVDGVFSQLERVYASTDPQGVKILARWLKPGSPDHVRAAATAALARIHTPAAVMLLGPALLDSNFQVRWRAIGGLAKFANNIPVGGMSPSDGPWLFRTDETIRYSVNSEEIGDREDYYLDFWRAWWSENQKSIEELVTPPNR